MDTSTREERLPFKPHGKAPFYKNEVMIPQGFSCRLEDRIRLQHHAHRLSTTVSSLIRKLVIEWMEKEEATMGLGEMGKGR